MTSELEKKIEKYLDDPIVKVELGQIASVNESCLKIFFNHQFETLSNTIAEASDSTERLSKSLNRITFWGVGVTVVAVILEIIKLLMGK